MLGSGSQCSKPQDTTLHYTTVHRLPRLAGSKIDVHKPTESRPMPMPMPRPGDFLFPPAPLSLRRSAFSCRGHVLDNNNNNNVLGGHRALDRKLELKTRPWD